MIAPIQRICRSLGFGISHLANKWMQMRLANRISVWQAGEFSPHQHARGGGARCDLLQSIASFAFALLRFHIGVCGPLCARAATIWSGGPQSGQRSHSRPTLSSQSQGCVALRALEISLSMSPPITSDTCA
jgi:hypothetical protein